MHLRRALMWSLLLLIALVASACGSSSATPTPEGGVVATGPKRGGTLTLSLGSDFVTFHPFFDVTNSSFLPQIFEAPIRISDTGDFEPWLAESWEQSADGLLLTLHLRHGVKFHTGREMTADDVVWSISHARDAEYGHQLSDRFQTTTGAVKLDEYTVRISYSERSAAQLDALTRLYIFPQEALGTIDTVPIGTGPFKFVEWIPGDSLNLERFDQYWRAGFPYLDKVVVKTILAPEARLLNLRTNLVDLVTNVSLADKAALATEEGLVVGAEPPGFAFYAFLMNINSPPFDNGLVRQALNYAIDRQEIADTVFYGQVVSVTVPYPPTSWVYPEDLKSFYTYNPERAKELLAQAGYPDGFSIKMMVLDENLDTESDTDSETILDAILDAGIDKEIDTENPQIGQAQVFQRQLAKIGISVELVRTETAAYWENLYTSQFSIVSHATANASVDPSGLFETAACCRAFRSFFGVEFTQEELQKPVELRGPRTDTWFVEYRQVINQANAETDHAARKALYHRALEILLEQGWAVPTVWIQSTYARWNYVEGFRTDLDGKIWLDETWLDE